LKYKLIIGSLVVLFLVLGGSYLTKQKAEMLRLDLANHTIETRERSLEKLSAILVQADVLKYDIFVELAEVHETDYWIDSDDDFWYVYFESLILRFNSAGSLVSVRTNSL